MNFYELDFFVYSSHKQATQSLLAILRINTYKVFHCHLVNQLS
jgi:hypothetical protein